MHKLVQAVDRAVLVATGWVVDRFCSITGRSNYWFAAVAHSMAALILSASFILDGGWALVWVPFQALVWADWFGEVRSADRAAPSDTVPLPADGFVMWVISWRWVVIVAALLDLVLLRPWTLWWLLEIAAIYSVMWTNPGGKSWAKRTSEKVCDYVANLAPSPLPA